MSRGVYGTFLETAVGTSRPTTGNCCILNTIWYFSIFLVGWIIKEQFLSQWKIIFLSINKGDKGKGGEGKGGKGKGGKGKGGKGKGGKGGKQ